MPPASEWHTHHVDIEQLRAWGTYMFHTQLQMTVHRHSVLSVCCCWAYVIDFMLFNVHSIQMSWTIAERRTAANHTYTHGYSPVHIHGYTHFGLICAEKIRATLNIYFVTWHTSEWMQYKRRLYIQSTLYVYHQTIRPHKHSHMHSHFTRSLACLLARPQVVSVSTAQRTHTQAFVLCMVWKIESCDSGVRVRETIENCCTERLSVRHSSSSNPHAYYYVSLSPLPLCRWANTHTHAHISMIPFWVFTIRFGSVDFHKHLKRYWQLWLNWLWVDWICVCVCLCWNKISTAIFLWHWGRCPNRCTQIRYSAFSPIANERMWLKAIRQ